jgi:hypothetical protein
MMISKLTNPNAWLLAITMFSLFPAISLSQVENDGFYIEIDEGRCLYNRVKTFNSRKSVCLIDHPIISTEEIVWMSEPKVDRFRRVRTLRFRFSEKGTDKLKIISKIYSEKNLAFVIDGGVICMLKLAGIKQQAIIEINEPLEDDALEYIYRKIKEKNKL